MGQKKKIKNLKIKLYIRTFFLGGKYLNNIPKKKSPGFVSAIGNRYFRELAFYEAIRFDFIPVNIISNKSSIENSSNIESGVIIFPHTYISFNVNISENTLIETNVVIESNVNIEVIATLKVVQLYQVM